MKVALFVNDPSGAFRKRYIPSVRVCPQHFEGAVLEADTRHCEPKEEIVKSCVEVVHDIAEFPLAFQLNYPDTSPHLIETLKIVVNLIHFLYRYLH